MVIYVNPYPLLITQDGCSFLSDDTVIGNNNAVIGYIDIEKIHYFLCLYMKQMEEITMFEYTVRMEQEMMNYSQATYFESRSDLPLCSSYLQSDNDFALDESHPGVKFAEMLLA